MNRRQLLKGLGFSSLGLGTLGLRGPLALGGESEAPKRLLVISHCHGWPYDSWKLRPAGLSTTAPWGTEAQFTRSTYPDPAYDSTRLGSGCIGTSAAPTGRKSPVEVVPRAWLRRSHAMISRGSVGPNSDDQSGG